MRVPNHEHAQHPWVIAQIAPDFALLDAWDLPVEGTRADFERFVQIATQVDPARSTSAPTRALFALRSRLGAWFKWDDTPNTRSIPGCAEATLSARLPEHLRGSAGDSTANAYGFVPVYRTGDEFAAELSNATVHGVLQLTWIPQDGTRYTGRLAVYVKPRGRGGAAYLKLIEPFRHLVVYPALTRQIGRTWARHAQRQPDGVTTPPAGRPTPVG